ncbi:MAG: GtrA family protein [Lachnospiraceae bacterium]|nr:GtrA family protein [Lachnospiraceae bacterium]
MENNKKQALLQQIMKFAVVGGLSSVIDFAIYSLIIVIFVRDGMDEGLYNITVMAAAFFGFTISLIFNYLTSMKFVFRHDENMDRRKEFTIFAILSLIGLGLNEAIIMGVLAYYKSVPLEIFKSGILYDYKEWVGKIIATGIVMVYNFVTRKIFIEKKD